MEKILQYTLRLKKLNCYMSGESDSDEIFIKYNGKKVWPEKKYIKMKDSSENLGLDFKIDKGSTHKFEIWDYDLFSPNDLLGTVTVVADSLGGPYTADMVKSSKGFSRYSIEWEIS